MWETSRNRRGKQMRSFETLFRRHRHSNELKGCMSRMKGGSEMRFLEKQYSTGGDHSPNAKFHLFVADCDCHLLQECE